MKLNYILIPENATRRPRLGHRHKVSEAFSPISRAGRRAPGEAQGKTADPPRPRTYWENITSRIEAFLKGVNESVTPQTNAAASMGQRDLFNTESFFNRFTRKSAFHRYLLHPDQEAPVVPSRPDSFYPPSPRSPTVPIAARRVTSCTRGIKISRSPDNGPRLNADLVPDRNITECVEEIEVKTASDGFSSFPLNKAGSPGSPGRSTALSNAGCPAYILPSRTTVVDNDSFIFSPQDESILGQRLRPASSLLGKAGSSRSSRRSTPVADMAFLPQAASILGQRLRPASSPLDRAGSSRSSRRSIPVADMAFSPQAESILGQHLRPASSPLDTAGSSCSSRRSTPVADMAFLPQAASILGQHLIPNSTKPPTSSFVFSPQDASILGQRLRPDASRSGHPCSSSNSLPSPCATLDRMSPSNEEKRGNGSSLYAPRHGSPPGHVFPSGFSGACSHPYNARSVSSFGSSRYGTPKETFSPVNVRDPAPPNTPISSEYCSPPTNHIPWKSHGDSCEHRELSIHRQPQIFPNLNKVQINQHHPPYHQSITHPQFFDYDSRLQPPIQPFPKGSSSSHAQEYTPHEPYFDHTSRQRTPVYGNQYTHSQYPYQVPLNWHSQYSHVPGINHHSPLEYSPYRPYFGHY